MESSPPPSSPNLPPTHSSKFPCCWAHTDSQLDTRAPQFNIDIVRDTQYLKKPGAKRPTVVLIARDKKGWTSRVGLANRLPQKDKW